MSPRILIVDDEVLLLRTLSNALREGGFDVLVASSAEEAERELENDEPVDLLVLDVKLPDIDGTKVLAALDGTHPYTRKIMITGYPSLNNVIEALRHGADDYLL